jgi:hypothetical protein
MPKNNFLKKKKKKKTTELSFYVQENHPSKIKEK